MNSENENKNKKQCLFSFHKMNKYYLFPFIVPIVCFSTKFFSEPIKMNGDKIEYIQDVSEENVHTFSFLYQMINSTSLIFGGLFYFIAIIRTKTENKANIGKNYGQIIDNLGPKKKPNRLVEYSIIVFMGIIITVYNVLKGYKTGHATLEKRLYFLFFFTIINVFMFKQQIFKHQKFSLEIASIGIIFIFTTFYIYLDYNTYEYIYDIFLFFGSFLYSLYLVLVKYMSEEKFYSPFLLLLLIGSISTLITIIGYIIFSLAFKGNLSYISNIFHCREDMYVCFGNFYINIIIYFLINTLLQILIYLVCYYFSPEVFAISDIISPFLSFISQIIKQKNANIPYIVLNILGYIIIILGSFIYNEIIVCNFWSLNENTWNEINKKGENEYLGIDQVDNDTIGDYVINTEENTLQKTNTQKSISSTN